MSTGEPRVAAGAMQALRLYDVAYAIDLAKVESLCSERLPGSVGRLRLTRPDAKSLALTDPPVEIGLGPVSLLFGGREIPFEATARVYDFGAISISLRHPVAHLAWAEFVQRATELEQNAPDGGRDIWMELLGALRAIIDPALERPSPPGIQEEYLFSIVESFEEPIAADAFLKAVDLVPLLTGERRELAEGARRDLFKHTFSYYTDDLVVLTWDQALLLQPSGDHDVADVLEVATAQLLELRYYDDVLDRELPRMYDRVQAAHRRFPAMARGNYSGIAHELHVLVAEVTEITERVDNALKVTEDVYLARVYGAALELFRVPSWAADVDRKLAIIRQTYTALHDEAASARAELLEFGILLLIVLEIVLAMLQ